MERTELVEYVHRKLDCLIGCAIQSGIHVSPQFYNITYPVGNWMYRGNNREMRRVIPQGSQCHPTDLILIGRKVFNANHWYESARYLMIPKVEWDDSINALHNGMMGQKARAYASEMERKYCSVGNAIRLKYQGRGF